ncbi:type II toxin-antitoxin system RelB/DinJ family antitoxin [Bifidobacterium sp. ESL0790]|uniref:type II toxin-antitoxin system RelB/DinJ family antitoxin n=1 Tax=Bifidobacterium sp. ESL0790 TaxID=2983233 RepID=UPI0023F6EDD0|nr:type II toxin-antitoxin system RelB/DinJ family antitoxin [Bifidobacterium sp. ESL0790]WEV72511.1 type II toxin-antitoxin system RelB/DinJ family antitoxin [Bifidobacterium sp. ESL0790]
MSSATIAVRTDPEVKKEAQEVLKSIGLDMSGAINIFLRQVISDQGLPFRPKRDAINARARYEAEHHIGKTFNSVDELMEELNNA